MAAAGNKKAIYRFASLAEKVDLCLKNRAIVARVVAKVLVDSPKASEMQIRGALLLELAGQAALYPRGWYDPPPAGVGVLFAEASDNFARSKFPTLRTQPYWPSSKHVLTDETVGMVYVSPVDKSSGIISDIGFNFYCGNNVDIQNHLAYCLDTVETIAEQAEVGMPFNQLHKLAQNIVDGRGLHNDWMITYNDPTRAANFGHSYPWTYQEMSDADKKILASGDLNQLKEHIEKGRIFISPIEATAIPETIAFSIEARLGSRSDQQLPCGYYYAVVTFRNGQKKIVTNYNPIFNALNINYMRSKFE
jgi:hypothetical protein